MSIKLDGLDNEVIEIPEDLYDWYRGVIREKLTFPQLQMMEFVEGIRFYIVLLPSEYFSHPENLKVEGWWGDKDFLKNNIKDYKVLTIKE